MQNVQKAGILTEGKTKKVWSVEGHPEMVNVENKNEITKDDNPEATKILENKAIYATATTCAVFSLLKEAGIPVAFKERISETEFLAMKCKMIALEVIVRRYAVGSYLKRFPNLERKRGEMPNRFHRLIFELFLKTTGGKIVTKDGDVCGNTPVEQSTGRAIDDPFIFNPSENVWDLRHPKIPNWDEKSNLHCSVFKSNILPENITVEMIEEIARKTFLVLEGAWAGIRCRLIDFKIEFGIGSNGELLVADVIDNDSWRLRTEDWQELSKQLFRDNANMGDIEDKYALVASLVNRFSIPKQAVVVWRGSINDQLPDFPVVPGVVFEDVIFSGHKSPQVCIEELEELLTKYPEGGVVLAYVGKSNGLGPTLSARTSWPVINIPLTAESFPADIWSNLRMPSAVPAMTMLPSYGNPILAALNILGLKNPAAYAYRQFAIEKLDK